MFGMSKIKGQVAAIANNIYYLLDQNRLSYSSANETRNRVRNVENELNRIDPSFLCRIIKENIVLSNRVEELEKRMDEKKFEQKVKHATEMANSLRDYYAKREENLCKMILELQATVRLLELRGK